jgi:hypothetical protein
MTIQQDIGNENIIFPERSRNLGVNDWIDPDISTIIDDSQPYPYTHLKQKSNGKCAPVLKKVSKSFHGDIARISNLKPSDPFNYSKIILQLPG